MGEVVEHCHSSVPGSGGQSVVKDQASRDGTSRAEPAAQGGAAGQGAGAHKALHLVDAHTVPLAQLFRKCLILLIFKEILENVVVQEIVRFPVNP